VGRQVTVTAIEALLSSLVSTVK